MRGILLFFIFSCFLSLNGMPGFSQIEFGLSRQHVNKVNEKKNVSKKLALYRKYFRKDSIKHVKQTERYWKAQSDSLTRAVVSREAALKKQRKEIKDDVSSKVYNTVYKPWAKRQAQKYIRYLEQSEFSETASFHLMLHSYLEYYFLQATQNHSLLFALKTRIPDLPFPKQLSSKLNDYKAIHAGKLNELRQLAITKMKSGEGANKINALQEKAGESSKQLGKYTEYGSALTDPSSSTDLLKTSGETLVNSYSAKLPAAQELNAIKGQIGEADKLKGLSDQYKDQLEQVQDSAYLKEQAKKKAEALAAQYLANNPGVMQGVQRKMSMLMKKYSVVPNSNDLSTAVKRNSLNGRTFFQRLQFAVNFQVISFDPVSVDFSPHAGYRINRDVVVGIGGLYRKTFSDSIPATTADALGYRGFVSYQVLNKFFVYGEYGRNSPGMKVSEGTTRRVWENILLVGIGRKFFISPKLETTIMAGYNFLHRPGDAVYTKPWMIRIGFQTSELAALKKQ